MRPTLRGGAWMPRDHLRVARHRSRQRHARHRRLCRRRGLDGGARQRRYPHPAPERRGRAVAGCRGHVHTGLDVSGKSHLGVFWAKGAQQTGTLFERWNTYSRVRVTAFGETAPFGWGFARTPTTKIDQNYLDIDADAATVITRYRWRSRQAGLPEGRRHQCRLSGAAACRRRGRRRRRRPRHSFRAVFRRQAASAASRSIPRSSKSSPTSSPISPAISIVQPGVSLVNAEARSYINHSSDRYDLVQISLIDTWAATAAGGLTLTENRLYTVEAWDDFYRALKPGGLLSVSRWYDPNGHRGEFYRLVAIAASALQRTGVPAADWPPCRRAERRQHRHRDHPSRRLHDAAMAGRADETSRPGLQDPDGAGYRFRRRHLDVDVRQGGCRLLRVAAGKCHALDRRLIRYYRPSTDRDCRPRRIRDPRRDEQHSFLCVGTRSTTFSVSRSIVSPFTVNRESRSSSASPTGE